MPHRLIAVGEVLWDVYPDRKKLGGAPANFACLSHRLGATANLISRVGDDENGREILARLAEVGLPQEGISVDAILQTGIVNVQLDEGQPTYTIEQHVAWDNLAVDKTSLRLAAAADAICFGTLAQRSPASRSTVQKLIAATKPEALRIFDVNLRPPFLNEDVIAQSLEMANVLKLNGDELHVLADRLPLTAQSVDDRLNELIQRYSLKLVILTRGGDGSLLLAGERRSDHIGKKVEIIDAVGAGDAFTAATTLGFLNNWSLDQINARANEIAAYVCTQPGATPPIPQELRSPFEV